MCRKRINVIIKYLYWIHVEVICHNDNKSIVVYRTKVLKCRMYCIWQIKLRQFLRCDSTTDLEKSEWSFCLRTWYEALTTVKSEILLDIHNRQNVQELFGYCIFMRSGRWGPITSHYEQNGPPGGSDRRVWRTSISVRAVPFCMQCRSRIYDNKFLHFCTRLFLSLPIIKLFSTNKMFILFSQGIQFRFYFEFSWYYISFLFFPLKEI